MIRLGAWAWRHYGSRDCALDVVKEMLARPPVVLSVKHEIVAEEKNLTDTDAASEH